MAVCTVRLSVAFLQQKLSHVALVFDVLLGLALLHLEEWWLSDVDMPSFDQAQPSAGKRTSAARFGYAIHRRPRPS